MEDVDHGTRCARCGSSQVAWRVKRLRAAGQRVSHLTLGMTCRGCGAQWEEAVDPEDRGSPEAHGDAPPPGDLGGPDGPLSPDKDHAPSLPAEF